MLKKAKKFGIIAIIAILFALLSFSIVGMIQEKPDYEDFCGFEGKAVRPLQKDLSCPGFVEATSEERLSCSENDGMIEYAYDGSGCPISFECNTCRGGFEAASEDYRFLGFVVTTIIGVLAIILGMYINSKSEIVGWIYAGILIGGILSVAFGTMSYFDDMGRFTRPIVLVIELALIIWIAIRTSKK